MLEFIKFCNDTWVSNVIRNSTNIFPVVEVFHLFGLTLLLAVVTVVDMRILGLGLRRQSIPAVAKALEKWGVGAALLTIGTGILLFLSEATKCYVNQAFPYKMWFLLAGIVLYLLTHRAIKKNTMSLGLMRVVAVLTLFVWYGVAVAGRAIAFV